MATVSPNAFTVDLSKLTAISVVEKERSIEIFLTKQSYQKIGQRMVLTKSEISLTKSEFQLLAESVKFFDHFRELTVRAFSLNQPPPQPPKRTDSVLSANNQKLS